MSDKEVKEYLEQISIYIIQQGQMMFSQGFLKNCQNKLWIHSP